MSEFFSAYGLFLVEVVTLIGIVLIVAAVFITSARRAGQGEGLSVKHINKQYRDAANVVKRALLDKQSLKRDAKAQKRAQKRREKEKAQRGRIFVLDFKGDIRASATASLRREVSAVLSVATPDDRVLVRIENAGGMVHEHGFAASQLVRIKQRGIPLLAAVDKVAASGGYLMASVADRIMAAPFAVVGSIGVVTQLPNFHRLLESKGIDYEQITAGPYKRTLTLFGQNTEEARQKVKEELEEIHAIFKRQIEEHRPGLDLDRLATGEHWYGLKALELELVDEIRTSDDFLLEQAEDNELYHVSYKRRRTFMERMLGGAESLLKR